MTDDKHHSHLMESLAKEYEALFNHSGQGMYIYLDDTHKVCNKAFANMLGYASETEWTDVETPFTEAFVDEGSQETLVSAYQDAMEHGVGSTNTVIWKKKNGGVTETSVILVPIVYDGHLFALHFVTPGSAA